MNCLFKSVKGVHISYLASITAGSQRIDHHESIVPAHNMILIVQKIHLIPLVTYKKYVRTEMLYFKVPYA